jgi:tetratricopeptide (TPR) repeat protein
LKSWAIMRCISIGAMVTTLAFTRMIFSGRFARAMNAKRSDRLTFKILLALLIASVSVDAASNQAIKAFNDGVKAFNGHQFNDAIPAFDEAISDDPDFAEAYFARGACKYYLKSLDGALLDLSDALRLKSDYYEAQALRGAVNYESDHWNEALEDFNAVLAHKSDDAQSLLGRAVILLKREDAAGAQRDFKAFLKLRPDDPLAPKIRQLLASLKGAGQKEAPPGEEQSAQSGSPSRPAASPQAHRPPALSSADLQKLADSLLSNPLSESYGRKVLRGDKAEAVGDIHSVPGVPTEQKSPNDAPQIVEPQ